VVRASWRSRYPGYVWDRRAAHVRQSAASGAGWTCPRIGAAERWPLGCLWGGVSADAVAPIQCCNRRQGCAVRPVDAGATCSLARDPSVGTRGRRWGGDGTLGLDGAGHAVTRDPPVRRGRSGGIRPSARLEVWVGWRRRHGAEPAPSRDRAPGREGGWCCSGVAPLDDQIRRSPRGGAREEGVLAVLRRRA